MRKKPYTLSIDESFEYSRVCGEFLKKISIQIVLTSTTTKAVA